MVSKTEECTRCHNKNFLIECACHRCGRILTQRDKRGRIRHHILGHYDVSKETGMKISKSLKSKYTGEKSHKWIGDRIGYNGLHSRLRTKIPKPEFCEECNIKPPHDLANISPIRNNPETYTMDINNWLWLCRRCHVYKDGIVVNNLTHNKTTSSYKLVDCK